MSRTTQTTQKTEPTAVETAIALSRAKAGAPRGTSWLLVALAVALSAMLVLQIGRLGVPEAQAELVSRAGNFTSLTADVGNSESVLLVLDHRSEDLLVYKVENQNTVEFLRKYELPRIFADARRRALGRN